MKVMLVRECCLPCSPFTICCDAFCWLGVISLFRKVLNCRTLDNVEFTLEQMQRLRRCNRTNSTKKHIPLQTFTTLNFARVSRVSLLSARDDFRCLLTIIQLKTTGITALFYSFCYLIMTFMELHCTRIWTFKVLNDMIIIWKVIYRVWFSYYCIATKNIILMRQH